MGFEVKSTNVSGSEISSEITIDFPDGLTVSQKNKIRDEAGELLVDHILGRVGTSKSPFKGGAWPALTELYKKFKQKEGRGGKANLEFTGDMLDALKFKRTPAGVRLEIKGKEAPKADGHNNFSGQSKIKNTRQFLPKEGDKFSGSVKRDVDSVIADQVAKSSSVSKITKSDVSGISTKRELNSFIRDQFAGVELAQAKDAILFDDDLRTIFGGVLGLF